jgi:hypothetical protein
MFHFQMTTLVASALILIGSFAIAEAQSQNTQPRDLGSLSFTAVDDDGTILPYQITEFTRTGSNQRSLLDHCQVMVCTKLPYGIYRYRLARTDVRKPTISDIQGELRVHLPQDHITRTPSGVFSILPDGHEAIADLAEPDADVRGRVLGLPHSVHSWIEFFNPFSESSFEVPLQKDGTFRILEPPAYGVYVMVIVADGHVLNMRSIQFSSSTKMPPIEVDLRTLNAH